MEILEEKIKSAERFRDRYYQCYPESTPAEKAKAVREKVLPLIQDIPLDLKGHSVAEYNHICGRILNICMEYDSNCEKYLIQAVKLDPSLSDAWRELGECVWKKKDFKTAIDCFRTSLSHKRSAKCLSALAIALRQGAISVSNGKARKELEDESVRLSAEAVELDPYDENAWHALGNSYLLQFFQKHQKDSRIMDKAREAYEKALQLGNKCYSSDLHLNYSTALKFNQNYAECLKHLKIAVAYDPGFVEAKEQLESLKSFLKQINANVRGKGKLSAKKMRNLQNSICDNLFGIYCKKTPEKTSAKGLELKAVSIRELKEGINRNVVIGGRVIAVVPNPETLPYTFVGCDKEGFCCAFAVYNTSSAFGMVVGDSIVVPEPHVIDVKIMFEDDEKENVDFRIIRITNPLALLKNGKAVGAECIAFCSMMASFVS